MHRIGPTGGFCLKTRLGGPSAAEHGATNSGSHTDAPLCEALGMLMSGGTVADLGAGRGQYGVCLGPHVVQYKAFDGSEGIETVTDGKVTFLDLSVPTWLGQTFDWVMSVEVGEHIAPSAEGAFISNLLRHVGGGGLVLSWATPGQGGHHHVNERPHDYIIDQVHTLSGGTLHLNSNVTSSLRRLSTLPWFKRNIMVFDRVKPGSSDTVTTAVASRS
ncbi:hypothetical protein HYH03_015059 [Edaphochlamys debaryana]|uniref:Uncharacterized protein n=1 Tax=Edaphochlamys debaryana TaxID=47281 RepID=A0A836BSW4_9CHLO|nr:hypothetical protein HYH03_015059 [Edaphochlamys debaryana]|eukprot:KAG2486234.1 hypothetical protein HYH03_015059 [Edaphochlamys debaryana]